MQVSKPGTMTSSIGRLSQMVAACLRLGLQRLQPFCVKAYRKFLVARDVEYVTARSEACLDHLVLCEVDGNELRAVARAKGGRGGGKGGVLGGGVAGGGGCGGGYLI